MELVTTRKGQERPVLNGYHFKTKEGKVVENTGFVQCPLSMVTERRQQCSITGQYDHSSDEKTTVKNTFCREIGDVSQKNATFSKKEVSWLNLVISVIIFHLLISANKVREQMTSRPPHSEKILPSYQGIRKRFTVIFSAFANLPNKTSETYIRMLNLIKGRTDLP